MKIVATAQEEFPQHYPASGWVEHDPADLWASTAATARAAMRTRGPHAADIAAIGITNQRETTLIWDRKTGKPIHNAIVWQDRRTADFCARLRADGHEPMITARTGLLADPYFSATKVKWLLDHVEGARDRARKGELAFGTVDSWLIWNLTGGRAHVTDATNAARTMLYDIHKGRWSRTICDLFDIPDGDAARGARLRRRFRDDARRSVRAGNPDPGRRGRPAGGDHRAGLFRARHDEIDLWHGLFCRSEHRRDGRHLDQQAAHDHRLPAGWKTDLCAGGLDLHRGRGGAMAARRDQGDPRGPGDPEFGRKRRSDTGSDPCARLCRPWRALLGARGARRDLWHDAEFGACGIRPRGTGIRGLPDPRSSGGDEGRLGRRRRAPLASGRWGHGRQ
jgi:hypothetical protein